MLVLGLFGLVGCICLQFGVDLVLCLGGWLFVFV